MMSDPTIVNTLSHIHQLIQDIPWEHLQHNQLVEFVHLLITFKQKSGLHLQFPQNL